MSNSQNQAIRDVFKGATLVYVGLIVEVLIAFVAQILAARFLTTGGFGSITVGTALLDVGAIVATLGLGEGLTRYLPRRSREERQSIARTALLTTAIVATVVGVGISFNASWLATAVFNDSTVTVSIRIFGATIPFGAVLTVAIGGIRGQEVSRYRVYVENLLRPTTRFALVVAAVLLGLGQAGFALAYALPYVVGAAAAVWLFWRTLPGLFSTMSTDARATAEVARYSMPFTVTGAATFVVRSIDIFLILAMLGSSAVAVYGVAYAAGRLVMLFSTATNYLATPVSSKLESEGEKEGMVSLNSLLIRWLVVVSVPSLVPFVLFPTEFISIVYRPAYASGANVLALLAVGFAIHNVLGALGNLHRALGNSSLLAVNSVVAALLNVGLNLYLIPRYGIIGAAIATTTSYVVMDMLMLIELRLEFGTMGVSSSGVAPVLIGVPLFGVAALVAPSIPGTLGWIVLSSGVFGIGYIGAILIILGLTAEEVMIIKSAQERFGLEFRAVELLLEWFS